MTICYEDAYILVVNKANNILVHHSKMAKNEQAEQSLVQLLFEAYAVPFYPIHRLDRKTSGLVIFAKKRQYVSIFQKLFSEQLLNKIYLGLVRGHLSESGVIDTPVKGKDALVYKDALTHYKCLQRIELNKPVGPYPTSRYSLVKLQPKTGRLHQLRIHMNKISHPLIGDPKYGDRFHNRMFNNNFNTNHLFLHAYAIQFQHPYTCDFLTIESNLPKHWHIPDLNLNF